MAAKKGTVTSKEIAELKLQLDELQKENTQLKQALQRAPAKKQRKPYEWLRKSAVVFFITLSVVSFMLFNVSSWVKNTILDTDTFVTTMQPLIAEPAVQQSMQNEITTRLFESVNIESELQKALPENLTFLSGPLASQIESFTAAKVGQVIASPQVYALWGESLGIVQSKVVGYIQNPNADGVISVNDVYTTISDRVSEDSKVSFLFNKQLPAKVGTITLAEVKWLPEARRYVDMITVAPIVFLLTSIISLALSIVLSVRKRRTTLVFLMLSIVMLFATLAALAIGNWQIADVAKPENKALAQAVFATITNPLENRTLGYVSLFGVLALVIMLTSNIGWIRRSRIYVDGKLLLLVNTILPSVVVPAWLQSFSRYIVAITWTVFIVLFIGIGVRIPPEYSEVKAGLLWASLAVAVLYIVHTVIRSLNRPAQKK